LNDLAVSLADLDLLLAWWKFMPRVAAPNPRAVTSTGDAQVTDKLRESASTSREPAFALLWVHPEVRAMSIAAGTMLLGRSAECDGVLSGSLISRRHASLRRRGSALHVSDEGSSNGIHVNGLACRERRLVPGDVLRLVDHVAVVVRGDLNEFDDFGELRNGVWGSRGLRRTFDRAEQVAKTGLSVLIQGESGTGKEALARAVHESSDRRGDLVALSCAALMDGLVEAELFGHERGAFTGAHESRKGYVQRAHRGTLFLDEVGELTPKAQARLLRAIQEGEAMPVGGSEPARVDVRWVAATHRDLSEEVAAGRFRLDLYHRLAGVTVRVPALRERPADILPLFQHFVEQAGGERVKLSVALVEALCLHAWPGNVRELRRVAESMLAVAEQSRSWGRGHLPPDVLSALDERSRDEAPEAKATLDDRAALIRVLRATRGNVSAAASRLGRSRQALHTALQRHGLLETLKELRDGLPSSPDT
jgi:transcriptional regulator with AAA-type ATPase domain